MSILQMGQLTLRFEQRHPSLSNLTPNPMFYADSKQLTGQETAFAKLYPTAETHLFEGTFAGIYCIIKSGMFQLELAAVNLVFKIALA